MFVRLTPPGVPRASVQTQADLGNGTHCFAVETARSRHAAKACQGHQSNALFQGPKASSVKDVIVAWCAHASAKQAQAKQCCSTCRSKERSSHFKCRNKRKRVAGRAANKRGRWKMALAKGAKQAQLLTFRRSFYLAHRAQTTPLSLRSTERTALTL